MAKTGDVPYFELVPDWVCDVASASTEKWDRSEKLPLYAESGVRHVWIIEPNRRTREAYRLQGSQWLLLATHKDSERARIEPFEALELDLALLWQDVR